MCTMIRNCRFAPQGQRDRLLARFADLEAAALVGVGALVTH
jgi:hypothetical protein